MNRKRKYLGLILIISCMVCLTGLTAQSGFDIRFVLSNYDTLNKKMEYDVQLKSSQNTTWNLADQNYRLFYNSGQAIFEEGNSLLPKPTYRELNLVQHHFGINATSVSTQLAFAGDLGFLNFAINLNDLSNGGVELPVNESWISVARLQFKSNDSFFKPNEFEIVWAREGRTNEYATSFVEIAEWIEVNDIQLGIGNQYFDLPTVASSFLKIKLFLQGPYDIEKGLMHDSLRKKNLIPLKAPYHSILTYSESQELHSKLEIIEELNSELLEDRQEKSMVDWVFLELRNKDNPTIVEVIKPAILQRNGQVVAVNGCDSLCFNIESDSFFLVVRHRNHLSIRSHDLINIKNGNIDFTNQNTKVYGDYSRLKEMDNMMLLWGGNADGNHALVFQGAGIASPDKNQVFFDVIADEDNYNSNANHIIQGYYASDVNMDGEVRFQGIGNDVNEFILFNILKHPNNYRFLTNFVIKEQI